MCASRLDRATKSEATRLDAGLMKDWLLPLDPRADKLDRGTVLVIGGSTRTAGAALLSASAILRIGAGRVQVATVDTVAPSFAMALPEALIEGIPATEMGALDPHAAIGRLKQRVAEADAVLIGPGLEDVEGIGELVAGLFPAVGTQAVVIVDALALSALPAVHATAVNLLGGRLILTPNEHELEGLLPDGTGGEAVQQRLSEVAERYEAVATSEGIVAAPDGTIYTTDEAVPGLGTAGSGDVLAGLIAGAAARCSDPLQATCWGTFLHLTAGSRLSSTRRIGFLAREIADEVPAVLLDF
ncbi:MAG: ADP-dependent NAD(P)H-hydrate dehydratase [Actinomycetota bacterium]|jgi:hydroxyethylthiazole kinase-like uncharacterized protein yjeF|nr:ADP-dependent NAD(P)H-hydrate dehydratase [Actinomycetota bacterium]